MWLILKQNPTVSNYLCYYLLKGPYFILNSCISGCMILQRVRREPEARSSYLIHVLVAIGSLNLRVDLPSLQPSSYKFSSNRDNGLTVDVTSHWAFSYALCLV
jgi:hypothetical protein